MNEQKVINASIEERKELIDKNGNDYLVLILGEESGERRVFVFPSRVKPERWGVLQEGQSFTFTIEESDRGSWLLADFSA